MPRRLVLWDIDGTLLTTGTAGRLALEGAAARVAGLDHVPHVVMGGKTDPQIVREILLEVGLEVAEIERLLPDALVEAERILARETPKIRAEGRVHPGVRELLEAMSRIEAVRQSLLTGNLLANAIVKVSAFGLEDHFDFEVGAYGTDDSDRNRLVPVALGRVRELRGEIYEPSEVWVIGDTRHDLACARVGNVRALIVGTGMDGFDAVKSLDADAVLEDLSDTSSVLDILLAEPSTTVTS